MKTLKFILRIISLVYVILVVLPMSLMYLIIYTLFEFLNGFSYHFFLKEAVPQGVIDVFTNINFYHPVLAKLVIMFVKPFVLLFMRFKETIYSIKF